MPFLKPPGVCLGGSVTVPSRPPPALPPSVPLLSVPACPSSPLPHSFLSLVTEHQYKTPQVGSLRDGLPACIAIMLSATMAPVLRPLSVATTHHVRAPMFPGSMGGSMVSR